MARTTQVARKSTGGKLPLKQVAQPQRRRPHRFRPAITLGRLKKPRHFTIPKPHRPEDDFDIEHKQFRKVAITAFASVLKEKSLLKEMKITPSALIELQEGAERLLIDLFTDTNLLAASDKRVTIMLKDMNLAKRLRQDPRTLPDIV